MNQQEILIIGANGQLGKALQEKYPRARAVDSDNLDITDKQAVNSFDWNDVKIIINAAAYTDVDGAETPSGRIAAWRVNAEAVGNLARLAQRKELTLVHISTDFVFDGKNDNHTENEPFSPLSVYGSSKAAGDLLISQLDKHYTLRTSWVIGEGKNFVRTMLELGKKLESLTVIDDHTGRPTFTSELVRAIDHMLTKQIPCGTYNVSNSGEPVSWAGWTKDIFKVAGYSTKVSTTTNEAYYSNKPESAPRPLQSTLNLDKIEATGFKPSDWKTDLRAYIEKEIE